MNIDPIVDFLIFGMCVAALVVLVAGIILDRFFGYEIFHRPGRNRPSLPEARSAFVDMCVENCRKGLHWAGLDLDLSCHWLRPGDPNQADIKFPHCPTCGERL